jgi:hypothetical protein
MTTRLLATGAILLAIGLTLAAVVAEWFAAFDACLASANCVAPGSVSTLSAFLGLLAIGVLLSVAGAVGVLAGRRDSPRSGSSRIE